jgi:hypothetical protein
MDDVPRFLHLVIWLVEALLKTSCAVRELSWAIGPPYWRILSADRGVKLDARRFSMRGRILIYIGVLAILAQVTAAQSTAPGAPDTSKKKTATAKKWRTP